MKTRVYDSFSDLPQSIVNRCSYPAWSNFFVSFDWYKCLYDFSLKDAVTPRIYCLYKDDDLLGVLFCGAVIGKRELRSLTNFYTQDHALINFSNDVPSSEIMDALLTYISCECPKWRLVDFRFMLKDFINKSNMSNSLQKESFDVSEYFMYQNWFLNISGRDFETYYNERSSKLRNTIKRKEKKLAKNHDYEIKIYTQLGDGLDAGIKEYTKIYNKSWKNPEPYIEFTPQLITAAAELGILRLGVLYIDTHAAAAQIWITTNTKALIYKLAYDEEYSVFSAGSILSREMFRQAIDDDKVAEIDYGVGSEPYKKDWMEEVREIHGVQALNKKTIYGIVMSWALYVKTSIKKVRKTAKPS